MAADTRRGLAWAFGAAFGIAGFAVPWKLAGDVGSTSTNTPLLLGSAAVFSTSLGTAVDHHGDVRRSSCDESLRCSPSGR